MNEVQIQAGRAVLSGNLTIPENATGLVLFAHGSGSSRHSPRNQFVAHTVNDAGLGTLLFDLLTQDEEATDTWTREHRFNIGLLAQRLVHATKWAKQQEETRSNDSGESLHKTLSFAYPAASRAERNSAMCSGPLVSIVMSMAVSPRFTP